MVPVVRVTAGIIIKNNLVLLARRPAGSRLAGMWEFPGGKIEGGESPLYCLVRELHEELGIRVDPRDVAPLDTSYYEYGFMRILLIGMTVRRFTGVLTPLEHAQIKWVETDRLASIRLAPADVPLARSLARRHSSEFTLRPEA